MDNNNTFLRVNVSGTTFTLLRRKILQHGAASRLGKLASVPTDEAIHQCDHYCAQNQEFFFARSAVVFNCILDFYNTGVLHAPDSLHICWALFVDELNYWQLDRTLLASCCAEKIQSRRVDFADTTMSENHRLLTSSKISESDHVNSEDTTTLRQKMWTCFERPFSSKLSLAFMFWSFAVLALSTVLIILGSYPQFHPLSLAEHKQWQWILTNKTNATLTKNDLMFVETVTNKFNRHEVLLALHNFCFLWFTVEFLLRFYAAPQRLTYLRQPLTVLDLVSIVPYYIFLVIAHTHLLHNFNLIRRVLFALRVLRMFQIMRLMQYSTSCRLVFRIITSARAELGFLLSVILVFILVLSTIMYFIESHDPTSEIQDIPTAMYWSFITVTTVGYGDIVPKHVGSRIFTCITTVLSLVTLALPVSVIVSKFTKAYEELQEATTDDKQKQMLL